MYYQVGNRHAFRAWIGCRTMLSNNNLDGSMIFDLPGVKPRSDLETLFKAVGFVVVEWGIAEQSLDLMIAIMFLSFDGHPLLKRRPTNLEKKVEFLHECFAKFPQLEQFKAESDALLTRFSINEKKRSDFVDGAIASFPADDDAFMISKIDGVPKQHHTNRSVVIDDSVWPVFHRELLSLGRDGQAFTNRVWASLKART
jgi:hypothetical protein